MITLFTGYDEEPKDKKKDQETQASEEESGVPDDGSSSLGRKSGFFSRMRQAVTRTRETFSTRINEIVALTREVDESSLEELETALIMSDIGVQTTTEILDALRAGVDPVFLPRPLKIVAALPRNAAGKLPRAALLEVLTSRSP